MVYNRFTVQVILRVLLLFATLVTWSAIFLRNDLIFNQLILAIATATQIVSMIRYVTKTNKELSRFLNSIRDTDFTARFSSQQIDPSFELLNRSFGDLIAKLGETETEKNAQSLFLATLIEEVPFGLIVMEASGHLRLINRSAQDLLDVPQIKNWEKLKSDRSHILAKMNEWAVGRPFLLQHKEQELTVSVTRVTIRSEELRIISVKNIQSELRKNETDAWHRLIRVLTHEIMNSVTPIASITDTLKKLLEGKDYVAGETLEDLREAVATVHQRSDGILSFVKRYRQLSRLPEPQMAKKDLMIIARRTLQLMTTQYPESSIRLTSKINEKAWVLCDESQIDQVLINLVKNAVEASEGTGVNQVEMQLTASEEDWEIYITDFGTGISDKQLERIFIPFYTTKKNGSGVGLGLSRQILQNHNGSLTCTSQNNPTTFCVRIPRLTVS